MDKYHSHMLHSSFKPSTSKTFIINWLRSMFVDLPQVLKIEDLGTGVIYCRVINHYYPNTIPLNRIVFHPKNQYDYSHNLKYVQQAFVQLDIRLNFDVQKVVKRKFLENWNLINGIYKLFTTEDCAAEENVQMRTGKKTYDAAFPESLFGSASKQPQQMPSSTTNYNFMLPVWERTPFSLQFPNTSNLPTNSMKISHLKDACSPMKGKWSVNSHMFQNNQNDVVDRIKEILLKNSHDTEKIRQLKMLLNISIEDEPMIKIQEDGQIGMHMKKSFMKEVKEEKEEYYMEKEQKGEKNQSDTYPEFGNKSGHKEQRLSSASKSRKPFKV